MDNNRLQGGLEAVHKAEKAVVSAQQNASPETYQKAHLELIKAQQLINELMKGGRVWDYRKKQCKARE